MALIDQDVERAVHRLELIVGLLDLHLAEHVLLVETGVAGGVPKVHVGDVRGVDHVVAALERLRAEPVLHDQAHAPALGMPEDQAGPGQVLDAEEVKGGAELAVVAFLASSSILRCAVSWSLVGQAVA